MQTDAQNKINLVYKPTGQPLTAWDVLEYDVQQTQQIFTRIMCMNTAIRNAVYNIFTNDGDIQDLHDISVVMALNDDLIGKYFEQLEMLLKRLPVSEELIHVS